MNHRSLFERPEWYNFLHARERLIVIRKSMDLIPKRNGLRPKDLSLHYLQAAMQTILSYSHLYDQRLATYTRSYFQNTFLAGLSVMFCTSVVPNVDSELLRESFEVLQICERTLKNIGTHLPDATNFILVFEALFRHSLQNRGAQTQSSVLGANPDLATSSTFFELQMLQSFVSDYPSTSHYAPDQEAPQIPGDTGIQQQLVLPLHGIRVANNSGVPAPVSGTASSFIADDTLSWAFLQNNLWNMEAGLGE